MRMKLNKSGQLMLVMLSSLLAATLISACGQLTNTLTADFVFVTSAKAAGANNYGEINVFEVNAQSGRMRQIPTSPFPSGGRNPVAEAVSNDNTTLFVANRDDNSIVRFTIGNDGKVYPQQTANTSGIFPSGVTVSGSTLFVADTYQPLPGCSDAAPCAGSITAMPLQTSAGGPADCADQNSICTGVPINSCNGSSYLPLTLSGSSSAHIVRPTAINANPKGSNLFVAAVDATSNTGYLYGFAISSLSCPSNPQKSQKVPVLTPLPGSPWAAGTQPSAIAQDPAGSYVYVTDYNGASVLSYGVNASGVTSVGKFAAGNQPSAIVVNSTGSFAYVTNSSDGNVTGYSVSNGQLTPVGSFGTGTQPVAVGIDPHLGQYLYTANFTGDNVSGFQINTQNGTLLNTQFSPFTSNANPTAVAAVPHAYDK